MSRTCTLFLIVAAAALAAPAYSQPVLPAHQGLAWDTPYPAGQTVCDPDGCCVAPEFETRYRLEWTLVGVPFGGNEHEFDLLYPEWPAASGCTRAVTHVFPTKVYRIAPRTLVRIALSGVNPYGVSPRSNVVEFYWPWVCEGTTHAEFRDCAQQCAATMGSVWCQVPAKAGSSP